MSADPVEALRRSPLFDQLSPAELDVLAGLCRRRAFEAGETVFAAGEAGASVYVLAEGAIEVLRHEGGAEKVLAVLAPPASFGETSLVDREVRHFTARARTAALTLQLTAEDLTTFRKRSRDGFTFVALNIARVLSRRLRETSQELARRL